MGRKRIPTKPGERFGLLTVVKDLGAISATDNRSHSLCICDCGNEKTFTNTQLRRKEREGTVQSCGCHAKKVWTELGRARGKASVKPLAKGERFGRLVVVRQMPHSVSTYFCQCDCGNTHTLDRASLVSRAVMSCGCKRAENAKQLHKFRQSTNDQQS